MDNLNMTPEMIAKAKAASSAEELMTLAKTYGVELNAREAQKFFSALREGTEETLDESDLDKIAGGSWERPAIPGTENKKGC